jgi:hypothetical protein
MSDAVVGKYGKPSSAFGAFCNAAFEDLYRDNMLEAREKAGCADCVDVGHEAMCADRAWGGERPRPDSPNLIVADELYPWLCTRKPGHEGKHVACTLNRHGIVSWGAEDSLRSSKCWSITVRRMLEIADYPLPGKFVRRPRMDLISQPGDVTLLPVMSANPNPEGSWQLKVLTPWHDCHMMVIDCPEEILHKLPNTRFCEGDLQSKDKQEELVAATRRLRLKEDFKDMPNDFYEGCCEVAMALSEIHPLENDNLREFFDVIVAAMQQYEEKHGMAY